MKKMDLGNEKISKLLLMFSIPCVISMLVNSVYNIVDQIFIGQGVGMYGNAATNVIFPLVLLFGAVAGLFGNGCAANISLRLGENKKEEAAKSLGSTVTLSIIVSLVLTILIYVMLPNLVNLFGCTSNVYDYALTYGKIIVLGAPALIIYSTLSSIIRADGSPKYSMIVLLSGAIINIILDALFILVFKMGVAGGAYATIIGQYVSAILALLYLRNFQNFKLTLKDYRINSSIFKVMLYGLSSMITQVTILVLFVFMNNVLTHYGALSKFGEDIPLSAYGIISKVNTLFISSVLGIAIGSQPIIGYNFGAGNVLRVKETLKKVYLINFCVGLFFNVIYLLFPTQLISLFGSGDNPLYIEFATNMFRIFLVITAINSFEMTTSIVIQSIGNAKKATACSFIRQIILFIPLTLLLTSKFGINGVLYAGPMADIICFIIVLFLFMSEYKKLSIPVKNDNDIKEIKNNNNHKGVVITINREYASGGRYVGKILSEKLNIPFYDKEIISLSSKESGFSEKYIESNEQSKKNSIVSEYNIDDKIFIAEEKVIKKVSKNSCVIVGRCADYILKDKKNKFSIFLYSDDDNKIKRASKYYNLSGKDILGQINKINKQREKHYKYYTNRNWKDFSNYDLAINVDILGVDGTAELIKDIIEKKGL